MIDKKKAAMLRFLASQTIIAHTPSRKSDPGKYEEYRKMLTKLFDMEDEEVITLMEGIFDKKEDPALPATDARDEEYRRAPQLDNYANLSPKDLKRLVQSLGTEPTLESAVYRAYRRGFIKGHLLMNVLHGTKIECETCGAPGRYDDSTGKALFFKDSVWFNKYTGLWECYDCWDR